MLKKILQKCRFVDKFKNLIVSKFKFICKNWNKITDIDSAHVINALLFLAAYLVTSIFMRPNFNFVVLAKELFAIGCVYFSLLLWFGERIARKSSFFILSLITAFLIPIIFANSNFSSAIICVLMLILLEFVLFEYLRGCNLFSSNMPVYIISENRNDALLSSHIFRKYKILKQIALGDSGKTDIHISAINSICRLEAWLHKLRYIPFFPKPLRLIYFAPNIDQENFSNLYKISTKFSIPLFFSKLNRCNQHGQIIEIPTLLPATCIAKTSQEKAAFGALFKGQRIWICYDGRECVFDLIKSFVGIASVDLVIICEVEILATKLQHRLSALYPGKIVNIKIMGFETFCLQENKPDTIFFSMPIRSEYSEDHNLKESVIGNVIQINRLIDFAQKNKVSSVFVLSTTKALNARTWIGATQRLGELLLQAADSQRRKFATKFHIIRLPDEIFDYNGIYGEIIAGIQTNGYITLKNSYTVSVYDEREIFAAFVKAIVLRMKSDDRSSPVLTVYPQNAVQPDTIVSAACAQFGLRKNDDIRVIYDAEPQPMDLENFPNISEHAEKTSIHNLLSTKFTSIGEVSKEMWTIEEINKMSTRELVSAVLQNLNDRLKPRSIHGKSIS